MIAGAKGNATGKSEVLMKPTADSLREILKGLEGLHMLSQWELSLTKDLCAKTEALLQSADGDKPPAPPGDPGSHPSAEE
jgi:hypothetical protein